MSPLDTEDAVRRGVQALVHARHEGLWRGFPTLAGTSDEWVSGFVVTHLAALGRSALGRSALERADVEALDEVRATLSTRQRVEGGWGFGPQVPPDADSTAWVLSALRDSLPTADVDRALDALDAHRVDEGYATYRAGSGIEEFVRAGPGGTPGWTAPHPDVTAAVLLASMPLGRPAPGARVDPPHGDPLRGGDDDLHTADPAETSLRRLVGSADGTGLVPAYWWRGLLYTTALVLRLLDEQDAAGPPAWEAAALEGLARLQTPTGGYRLGSDAYDDAFQTALALECWCRLARRGGPDRRDEVARALIAQQGADGGWVGGYVLRLPAPDVTDPRLVGSWRRGAGGGNAFVPDPGGVFATSSAVHALDLYSRPPGDRSGRRVVEPAGTRHGLHERLVPASAPGVAAS